MRLCGVGASMEHGGRVCRWRFDPRRRRAGTNVDGLFVNSGNGGRLEAAICEARWFVCYGGPEDQNDAIVPAQ